MSRERVLNQVRQNPEISVLIIGGGINGIGTFRELALQGVDVLLVEKGDFCSGASAASSHMVHGGLRYLENGEFRLVREALKERDLLLQNAPHYVKPLPTTIPIFSRFSGTFNAPLKFIGWLDKPSERGAFIIRVGLWMYDLFSAAAGHRSMPWNSGDSRRAALAKRPALNPEIVSTATYYDAWMPYPERICMELILDTEALSPHAHALNYVKAVSGAGDSVTLRDEISGETFEVKPRLVINAAGPWIDFANQDLQRPTRFIGGTKGSHLMVDNPALLEATQGHEMFFENNDGRIVLFFPLGDKVLMGTTDIPVNSPEDIHCTPEEEAYILGLVKKVFPGIDVKPEQVVFRFSGVRPLPRSDAATAGQISRDHSIQIIEPGNGVTYPIYSLVGGKWTTFRAFSEQTADKALRRLGRQRQTHTEQMAIGGGRGYPQSDVDKQAWLARLSQQTRLPLERLTVLFERYGTRAAEIAVFIAAGEDAPLTHHADYSRLEVAYLAEAEKVIHLDDFVLRRSLLAMLGHLTCPLVEELAEVIGGVLGWSEETRQAEVTRLVEMMRVQHGVILT